MSTVEREPRIPMTRDERDRAFAEIESIHTLLQNEEVERAKREVYSWVVLVLGALVAVSTPLLLEWRYRLFQRDGVGLIPWIIVVVSAIVGFSSSYVVGYLRGRKAARNGKQGDAARSGR